MWWDSIENLSKLNISFQWIAGIFGFLGALAIVAALIFGGRLSSLQNVKDKQQTKLINKLKAEVVGRRLTPEMREKIATSLKPTPNVKLEFTSIQGDRESFLFAKDIYSAFKETGWSVEEIREDQLLGTPGSVIQVRQKSPGLEVGQQIVGLLCSFGFEAKLVTNEKWEPGVVDIVVTRKP